MKDTSDQEMLAKMTDAEPRFTLRGQDVFSAYLVSMWADLAEAAGSPADKVAHARQRARAMRNWLNKKVPD